MCFRFQHLLGNASCLLSPRSRHRDHRHGKCGRKQADKIEDKQYLRSWCRERYRTLACSTHAIATTRQNFIFFLDVSEQLLVTALMRLGPSNPEPHPTPLRASHEADGPHLSFPGWRLFNKGRQPFFLVRRRLKAQSAPGEANDP